MRGVVVNEIGTWLVRGVVVNEIGAWLLRGGRFLMK